MSALELAQCVEDRDGAVLVAALHVAYGDDMFRKVSPSTSPPLFVTISQGEFSGAMKQYAAGLLPLRSILRRFPDLIQGTADAAVDSVSGGSHPVMKADDPKFVQAVVQLVRDA